jgi:3-methyladenine DNA glycosylase Tag
MKPASFDGIYQRACDRKGGEAALKSLLGKPASKRKLKNLSDADWLSAFSKKIFQSGFVWKVVEAKWPNFEKRFWQFDIDKLVMMPDEMLEQRAGDKQLIRNARKIFAIRENAMMIEETRRKNSCSFSEFIANWPEEDIVGLWAYLKKNGCRLGGNTGPYSLRSLGKDTFLLTRDVEHCLRQEGIIDTGIQTKSAHHNAQKQFNHWREETGLSLTALSQVVAFSAGSNRVNATG